jgi:hypothetical protein
MWTAHSVPPSGDKAPSHSQPVSEQIIVKLLCSWPSTGSGYNLGIEQGTHFPARVVSTGEVWHLATPGTNKGIPPLVSTEAQ